MGFRKRIIVTSQVNLLLALRPIMAQQGARLSHLDKNLLQEMAIFTAKSGAETAWQEKFSLRCEKTVGVTEYV
jgi:hypothetical protein